MENLKIGYYTLNLWDYDRIQFPKGLPPEWKSFCICTNDASAEQARAVGYQEVIMLPLPVPKGLMEAIAWISELRTSPIEPLASFDYLLYGDASLTSFSPQQVVHAMAGFVASEKAMMMFPRARGAPVVNQMRVWMSFSSARWSEVATEHEQYRDRCEIELKTKGLALHPIDFMRSHIFAWNMRHSQRQILVKRLTDGYKEHNNGTTIFNYMLPLWPDLIHVSPQVAMGKIDHIGGVASGKPPTPLP